jgi:hypothetical protein
LNSKGEATTEPADSLDGLQPSDFGHAVSRTLDRRTIEWLTKQNGKITESGAGYSGLSG